MKLARMIVGERYALVHDPLRGSLTRTDEHWLPDPDTVTMATYLGPTDDKPRRARMQAVRVSNTPNLLWGPPRDLRSPGDMRAMPTSFVAGTHAEYEQAWKAQQSVLDHWAAAHLPRLRAEAERAAQLASAQRGVPVMGSVFTPPPSPRFLNSFVLHTHVDHLPVLQERWPGPARHLEDMATWEEGDALIVVDGTHSVLLPTSYGYGLVR